jgi:hypothetical protein
MLTCKLTYIDETKNPPEPSLVKFLVYFNEPEDPDHPRKILPSYSPVDLPLERPFGYAVIDLDITIQDGKRRAAFKEELDKVLALPHYKKMLSDKITRKPEIRRKALEVKNLKVIRNRDDSGLTMHSEKVFITQLVNMISAFQKRRQKGPPRETTRLRYLHINQ